MTAKFTRCPRFLRRVVLPIALPALALLAAPVVEADDSPVGLWQTIDDHSGQPMSLVKISESGGKLSGKIVKLYDDPDALCTECDGDDRDAPMLGMTIMWGLERNDDAWDDGRIFDPRKGKTYNCKIWLDDGGDLTVRGSVGPFSGTRTWHRVASMP
jgi:uncharacterized protein (DUF2147 family)